MEHKKVHIMCILSRTSEYAVHLLQTCEHICSQLGEVGLREEPWIQVLAETV